MTEPRTDKSGSLKIWLAYRFIGEKVEVVRELVTNLTALLHQAGFEAVCMAEDVQHWNIDGPGALPKRKAVIRAKALMRTCDMCLTIYTSTDASDGRSWESGFFEGDGKPTVAAIQCDVALRSFMIELHDTNFANNAMGMPAVIRFRSYDDIVTTLLQATARLGRW